MEDAPVSESLVEAVDPVTAFPIVAVGASAGGLEPCERFFAAMPPTTGAAFVVIQHLSPDFRSLMDELLGRHASMPIVHAEDGMTILPDTIYLNAPRQSLGVKRGQFTVEPFGERDMARMPIDEFFASISEGLGEQAVGVVLSGSGHDGSKGGAAIRAMGGSVYVQDPDTAKFDSMPNATINAGLASAIAPAEVLPDLIVQQLIGAPLDYGAAVAEAASRNPTGAILDLLHDRFGTDFGHYKRETVQRRLQRRSELLHRANLAEYYRQLATDANEVELLYNDLLIEVTSFFRDTDAFAALQKDVIPKVADRMTANDQVRIWVPGCASGDEAFSIAMLLAEHAHAANLPLNAKIIATDVHHRSLDAASLGAYTRESLTGLSEARIARYFEAAGDMYHVRPFLRRMLVFSHHNLLNDPPFTRMDLVSCRNLLIYFNETAQQKSLSMFHFALRKGGFLFLGSSETLGDLAGEFETINRRWRIFEKLRDVRLSQATALLPRVANSVPAGPRAPKPAAAPQPSPASARVHASKTVTSALEQMLRLFAPAGFLVNASGELLHVFGKAAEFLTINDGVFTNRLGDLVIEDLRFVVCTALERLGRTHQENWTREVPVGLVDPTGEVTECRVRVSLHTLAEDEFSEGFGILTVQRVESDVVVVHHEATAPDTVDADLVHVYTDRIASLERALAMAEASLQTTIEELETSNEELQATNEELMASNEELQSTNEELHSVNEELYTVSAEHQHKIDELTEMQSDMEHLLRSTEIGTIYLDEGLRIRRFTPAATRTFNLLMQDLGRPIDHVTARFDASDLPKMISKTLDTLRTQEREVVADGVGYLLRLLPYQTDRDAPMGVVITMIDIDELRRTRTDMARLQREQREILADIGEILVRWEAESQRISFVSGAFAALVEAPAEWIMGQDVSEILPPALIEAVGASAKSLQPGAQTDFVAAVKVSSGKMRRLVGTVRKLPETEDATVMCQMVARDADPLERPPFP